MNPEQKLEAQVKAQNRAAEAAMALYDELSAIFAPFVGKSVCKKSGGLLAKVEALLPKLACDPKLYVYRYTSSYSPLVWIVKACEVVDGGSEYREVSVYVGELNGGDVLTKLCDRPNYRCDYSAAEIKAIREEVKAAQKVLDEAKAKLHPFGEY